MPIINKIRTVLVCFVFLAAIEREREELIVVIIIINVEPRLLLLVSGWFFACFSKEFIATSSCFNVNRWFIDFVTKLISNFLRKIAFLLLLYNNKIYDRGLSECFEIKISVKYVIYLATKPQKIIFQVSPRNEWIPWNFRKS